MDFGSFAFTPDAVATVVAGFVVAGVGLGMLVAALNAVLNGIEF